MERRHSYFVQLWNASCDDPLYLKPESEIIKEVVEWERLQSKSCKLPKEYIGHKEDFRQLIEKIDPNFNEERRNRSRAKFAEILK